MEDDDLEYDISFPAPTPEGDEDEDDDIDLLNDFVIAGETKEPVIILIGWAGCKDQYLAKYSKIYEQKRCITIRYIPPKEIAYFKPELVHVVSVKLLDLIGDYSLEENPIFFHIFSNNGSFVYAEITKILHSESSRKYKFRICGTIVDSAPGKQRLIRAARVFALSSGGSTISRLTRFLGIMAYLIFLRIYFFFSSWLFKRPVTSSSVSPFTIFEAIKEDKSAWPQLFLYSKDDKIIPYTDVEEVVSYRRDRMNLSVDSECWEKGGHVSIFRESAESYANRCWLFVNDCLRRENDQACGGT